MNEESRNEIESKIEDVLLRLPQIRSNHPLTLGIDEVHISAADKKVACSGHLALEFFPSPHYILQLSPDCQLELRDLFEPLSIELPERDIVCEGRLYSIHDGIATLKPSFDFTNFIPSADNNTMTVGFYLSNFVDFSGEKFFIEAQNKNKFRRDYVEFQTDKWSVTICPLPNAHETFKELKTRGGYAVTHVGLIEKLDGDLLAQSDVESLLRSLHYFLSFAQGRWIGVVLPHGLDRSLSHVWQDIRLRYEKPWKRPGNWLDPRTSSILERSFGLFEKWLQDSTWNEPLEHILYWYLRANDDDSGIDGNIVLAHTALELFAFNYCVNHRKLISKKEYNNLPAAVRILLFFSWLGLPVRIPGQLLTVHKLARSRNWSNSAEVLTAFRNKIVHHEQKTLKEFSPAFYEIWNLSLWYLELGILKLIEYEGPYVNRVKSTRWGEPEPVPWSVGR